MEKLKNFLEKYKFLLIILTFISTVLLIKKDYLETVVFKSSVMKNDIDIYKENCNFDFEYLKHYVLILHDNNFQIQGLSE